MPAKPVDTTAPRAPFRLNERCIKPNANEIDGQRIESKAMDVLVCLADAAPEVVPSATLLDRVWPGVVVDDNVVHQAIAQLRKALGDDRHSPRYIENIHQQDRPRSLLAHDEVVHTSTALTPLPSTSLAVLPFVDLSPGRDQQFFADGVAEEILTALSGSRQLTVIGRGSSFAFRDRNADVATIARRLNVEYVLEGSVRLAGSQVRIDVRLVDTTSAVQRWAQGYDGRLDDIFAVQADIAQNVAARLEATLAAAPDATVRPDPDTYMPYLQARHLLYESDLGKLPQVRALLTATLDRDPSFTPAWLQLAGLNYLEAETGQRPYDEGWRLAREAVERAAALEPDSRVVHAWMTWMKMFMDHDLPAAARHLERSLAEGRADTTVVQSALQAFRLEPVDHAVAPVARRPALARVPGKAGAITRTTGRDSAPSQPCLSSECAGFTA